MSDCKWTPGPWVWTYNKIGGFALTTPDRGRLYVMDFGRQGMQGATPRFSYWEGLERGRQGGIMMDASHYLTNEGAIDHPDAHLIAAAPELYEALRKAMSFIESHVADPDITEQMAKAWVELEESDPYKALAKARGES